MNSHHHTLAGPLAISQTFPDLSLSVEKGNCIAGQSLGEARSRAGWGASYSPQVGRASTPLQPGSRLLAAKQRSLTRAQQTQGWQPAPPRPPLALLTHSPARIEHVP